MALDNANFIAELSITDPPGTDPLAQGDDHIRTTKRAVQQSFPFIDKQVDLTADQLNQAAIKNESNVFTVKQTIATELDITMASAVDSATKVNFYDFSNDQVRWYLTEVPEDALQPLAFGLVRNDAAGAFASVPWIVNMDTGILDFDHIPTIKGDPIWIAGEIRMLVQGATVPSGNWFLANGTNGTVALQDRILGAQGVFTGTQNPFLDVQTDPGDSGSTVLTEAQMPDHGHLLLSGVNGTGITDTTLAFSSTVQNDTVIGGNRENQNAIYIDDNNNNKLFVAHTGGDGGHVHDVGGLECNPAGSDAFQVMPFTYFMQVIQYVP